MSTLIPRLVREPALLVGLVTGVFGVLLAFGLELDEKQTGSILVLLGAVMALVRFLTTPAAEVAVQVKDGEVLAGAASTAPTGTVLTMTPARDQHADKVIAHVPIAEKLVA